MAESTLDYLKSKIDEEINRITVDISSGTANDFAEYKYSTGIIRGLNLAAEQIEDLQERLENDDD